MVAGRRRRWISITAGTMSSAETQNGALCAM
jgi:hypothetical protein